MERIPETRKREQELFRQWSDAVCRYPDRLLDRRAKAEKRRRRIADADSARFG